MTHEEKWLEHYKYAVEYYNKHHDLKIPASYEVTTSQNKTLKLGWWIFYQRKAYKGDKSPLSTEQINLLNKIGMVWQIYDKEKINDTEKIKEKEMKTWLKYYKELLMYYKKHGNVLMNIDYKVIDENGETLELGNWLTIQQFKYEKGKLSLEKIKLLNKTGMNLNTSVKMKWLENYEYARLYYLENNNLLVPQKFKVYLPNKTINLGSWINTQRQNYKKNILNVEQINLLNDIEMVWDVKMYNKKL